MKKKRRKIYHNSGKNISSVLLVIPEVLKPFLHVSVAKTSNTNAIVFVDIVTDYEEIDSEDRRLNTPFILNLAKEKIFLTEGLTDLSMFEVEKDMIGDNGLLSWYLRKREDFKMKFVPPNNGVNSDAKEPRENLA